MRNLTLSVPDISCAHCKSAIEGAVGELSGVDRVEVRIDAREVDVAFDDTTLSPATIFGAIEDQGYEVAQPPR